MLEQLKKRWKYFLAKRDEEFEANADPKVQLEQAISEAKDQHLRLRAQAANVIANQKQTEMRLNRSLEELERVHGNARQAVKMADDAATAGDRERMERYTDAAEQFANRLINLEEEIESLKSLCFQASESADQAKSAVELNASLLRKKLVQRQALLSQLDQAKMQETVNSAVNTLSAAVVEDAPSFEQVRTKIETRYAKAKAVAELTEGNVEAQVHEVEKAALKVEAQARLATIRTNLGLQAPKPKGALAEPSQEVVPQSTEESASK